VADPGPSVRMGRREVPGQLERPHLRRRALEVDEEGGREVDLEAIALSHRGAPS